MAWMIQVNGFLVDARFERREIQEEALRKGLISYIPSRPQPSQGEDEEEDGDGNFADEFHHGVVSLREKGKILTQGRGEGETGRFGARRSRAG